MNDLLIVLCFESLEVLKVVVHFCKLCTFRKTIATAKNNDMKMPRIKFEWSSLTVLLFPLLLDFTSAALYLTPNKTAPQFLGSDFMVTCKDDTGRSVTWSGPRGPLGTKSHPAVEVSSFGTSLVFMPIAKDDGGTYNCRADEETVHFTLNIAVPLTFMDTPPVQKGREGTNVTLRCEVQGGDKPILTWTSEGKELSPPKYEQIGDGLLIRDVTRNDSRTYTCRAMQVNTGNVRDQQIKLEVEHKPVPRHPRLWKAVDQVWGFIGGDVNLTCEADAYPPPKIEWYRRNHLLTVKDRNAHESNRSILQLHINTAKMFGEYKCKVWNSLGKLERIITLEQGVQPEPPELIELQDVTTNSLDLVIRGPNMTDKIVPRGMEPNGYRVRYKTSPENLDWQFARTVDFQKHEDDVYVLKDLTRDMTYEIQVATKNLAGISGFTNTSTFKTLQSAANSVFYISNIFTLVVYSFVQILSLRLL